MERKSFRQLVTVAVLSTIGLLSVSREVPASTGAANHSSASPRFVVLEKVVTGGDNPFLLDVFGGIEYGTLRNLLVRRKPGMTQWEKIVEIRELTEIIQILPITEEHILVYGIGPNGHRIFSWKQGRLLLVHEFRPGVMLLRRGWTVTKTGDVFLGEYTTVSSKSVPYVDVLRFVPGNSQFVPVSRLLRTAGGVRHIHFVQEDPYEPGALYVGTGDSPNESRLLVSRNRGESLMELGRGRDWTIVGPGFARDAIYWGTDTVNDDTWIIRYDKRKREISRIQPVHGTVYWTQVLDAETVLVYTTVEPLSKRWDKSARIFLGSATGGFVEVYRDEVMRDGVYGRLNPTVPQSDGTILVQCMGLKGCPRGHLRIRVTKE